MLRNGLRAAGLAVLGAACLAAPARADWTVYGGNIDKTFYTTEKLQSPLAVLWKHATSVVAERSGNRGGPVIKEGVAYFPSKNRVYAVDVTTGELKWRAPEGDPNDPKIPQISSTPVVTDEFVYVPDSSGTLTAYTVDGGQAAWTFKTGGSIRSAPIVVGNSVIFGSDDDFVYAIETQTGSLLWKSNERGKNLALSDDPAASPVYYNGVVYINSADMKLWAFQADTGRLIWQSRVAAPSVDISPVANNGRVYLAAGSTMYQFRLRGGQFRAFPLQQWVGNDITSTPIITEKFWFFGDRDGYFHAFSAAGRPAKNADGGDWKIKLEGKPIGTPVMTQDTIYVSTDRGFIYGLDIAKGQVVWTYRTEAPKGITPLYLYYAIRAPLAASDGKLFVLGDDGTLTCLAPDAPDDEPPMITTPRPGKGVVMNGAPPITLGAYLWDEGSGINPDTVEVLLDGKPIDQDPDAYNDKTRTGQRKGWTYDPLRRMLRYATPKAERGQPEQPLLNGRHKVQIQAADWKGNFNSLEWTFVVDNSLPRNAVETKPKSKGQGGQGAGGYPGGGAEGGGAEGAGGYPGGGGGSGGPGGQQGGGRNFRGRFGGYTYGNRGQQGGQGGYGFGGQRGSFGGGQRGGFGGRGGGFGGRGGGIR